MNHVANQHQSPGGLYAHRPTIHPRTVTGANRRRKNAVNLTILGLLTIVPWLRWDRGPGMPDQAVLFDFSAMRGYFLDIAIWPQEFYFLTAILIVASFGLFLVTALRGRMWCGFACPQTVWTDIFVWIEKSIQGDRNARLRLDRMPLSFGKAVKKGTTHALWLAVSAATALSFVFFFTDAPSALTALANGTASVTLLGFVLFFTLSTYLLAGWAREQVCFWMCPWPRIQGAMLDHHTVTVEYDRVRGETRGPARIGQDMKGRGHCVDCRLCLQVCPTGIDIREGLQMECIGCGLCADACDGVMARFGLPSGLVGWTAQIPKPWFRRPRVLLYAGLMAVVVAGMVVAGGRRSMLELNLLHERSPLFVTLADGSTRNDYTVKVINRERRERDLRLSLSGLDGATADRDLIRTTADDVTTFRLGIRVPARSVPGDSAALRVRLTDAETGEWTEAQTFFAGGVAR